VDKLNTVATSRVAIDCALVQRKTCYDVTPSNAKEAKSFDAWFYSLTKKEQDKLRDGGVLPYKEMWKPSRVFEIKENHNAWSSENVPDHRTETDNFVTRECVGQLLKSFIDALAFTNNYSFRRHVELVRWALELPGRMPSRNLADMYGLSHEWVQKRARKIREAVNVSDMLILEPYTEAERMEINKHNKKPMNKGRKPPYKESPKHPPKSGVA